MLNDAYDVMLSSVNSLNQRRTLTEEKILQKIEKKLERGFGG